MIPAAAASVAVSAAGLIAAALGLADAVLALAACAAGPRGQVDWQKATAIVAGAGDVDAAGWKADLDFLVAALEKRHPNPYHSVSREAFLAVLYAPLPAEAEAAGSRRRAEARAARLFKALARLREGHTAPSSLGALRRGLPLRFERGGDGYYLAAFLPAPGVPAETAAALGRRLVSLAGVPADEAAVRLAAYSGGENPGHVAEGLKDWLPAAGILADAGLIPWDAATVAVGFAAAGGAAAVELALPVLDDRWDQALGSWTQAAAAAWPAETVGRAGEAYWWRILADAGVALFQYNSCSEMPGRPFNAAAAEFFAAAGAAGARALVVDLRNNSGGNSAIFSSGFLPKLKRSPYVQAGRLYVLVGPRTFSSGMFAVRELIEAAGPVFVGEPTGQGVNHYGYTGYLMLPNTGFVVSHSTERWRFGAKYDRPPYGDAVYPSIAVARDPAAEYRGEDPLLAAALAAAAAAPPF